MFSAAIPEELGGGGASYLEVRDMLRTLAQYCGSTALALSMHQHLIAATVWKYRRGQGGEAMLKNVAQNQLVLVSTGAGDWLESNGSTTKTAGGYLVSAHKHFASQSAVGDMLITTAPFMDEVLHFPVPMNAEGVTVLNDWRTMGMRGTGSHTVKLENVFVPDAAIVLRRPRGVYHPIWNVVLIGDGPLQDRRAVGWVTSHRDRVRGSCSSNHEYEKRARFSRGDRAQRSIWVFSAPVRCLIGGCHRDAQG